VTSARENVVSLDRHRMIRQGTEPWATKQEIARHLGFSLRWVELRVRDGMPCRRIGGRLRFRQSEVEAWLGEREAS